MHCIGASVYSLCHKSSDEDRGYGCIQRRGDTALDGTPTWFVEWERPGARQRAFKETSLEVALIPHSSRVEPSGLQQPILVVLGPHKGKRGTTVAQVSTSGNCREACHAGHAYCHAAPCLLTAPHPHFHVQRGWGYTCDIQGEMKKVYLHAHQLHATDPPPEGCTTGPSDRKLLKTVPVESVPVFLHDWHSTSGNPDLQRRKPSSALMLELTLRTRSIDDLSDDEVQALHYEAAGKWMQHGSAARDRVQSRMTGHLLTPSSLALQGAWVRD